MTLRKAATLAVVSLLGFASLADFASDSSHKAQLLSAKSAQWLSLAEAAADSDLKAAEEEVATQATSLESAVRSAELEIAHEIKVIEEDEKTKSKTLATDLTKLDATMKALQGAKAALMKDMQMAQELAAIQAAEDSKKAKNMIDKKAAEAATAVAKKAAKKAEEEQKKMDDSAKEALEMQTAVEEKIKTFKKDSCFCCAMGNCKDSKDSKDSKVAAAIAEIEATEQKGKEATKKVEAEALEAAAEAKKAAAVVDGKGLAESLSMIKKKAAENKKAGIEAEKSVKASIESALSPEQLAEAWEEVEGELAKGMQSLKNSMPSFSLPPLPSVPSIPSFPSFSW
ncbi:unnamed protein product [Polarella glacialis]|uniref:Uncharacterized protein n=1 Tax=Polarella glacialis TaxID=89957 RepID=A0A813DWU3_POLGL|nr:unnamed protein product [Polarella glacialis]CAE8601895.1 unnamed protein product [Polarella glacialis]CAE8664866.1 unnamed protein product [Polarella glacialis]